MFDRSSGVLLHISSLPGDYGIGSFGKEARAFIDFLHSCGCRNWQVLPFTPTDMYNSPYASTSAFAGNAYFIDLDILFEEGLLTEEEITQQKYANPYTAAFEFLNRGRMATLYKAYTRAGNRFDNDMARFREENAFWLEDYCLYTIIKEATCGKDWYDWEDGLKLRRPDHINAAKKEYADTIRFLEFVQYIFYTQWDNIRRYAKSKKVSIIGDLPIYVALESSDVWGNQSQFDLDENGRAKNVAGVPPDYFSADGQKWGNALYDWKKMKADGYGWWMNRLKVAFKLFDTVRIDHFRAFSEYWAVPADAETAKTGKWIKGPGKEFFDTVFDNLGELDIIAEDLGIIDEGVVNLMEETGFPGMRVMQFGFIEDSDNIHLPHNYPKNCFAYTGTHDNNTLLGWLWETEPRLKKWALDYCDFKGNDWATGGPQSESCRAIIRTLWSSAANVVIVPIQDLCGFGTDTKMNIPGVPNGNWAFRISHDLMRTIDTKWISKLNKIYKR